MPPIVPSKSRGRVFEFKNVISRALQDRFAGSTTDNGLLVFAQNNTSTLRTNLKLHAARSASNNWLGDAAAHETRPKLGAAIFAAQ